MSNEDYLKQIEAMDKWVNLYTKHFSSTGENLLRIDTLLLEGMYQCVADEIQRCLNIKDYKRSDYLIKRLCETGWFYDWEKYDTKVLPAYAYSQSKRKPGKIPGDFPSCLQVYRKSLRYTKNKDSFVIEGTVSFGDIYLKRGLI